MRPHFCARLRQKQKKSIRYGEGAVVSGTLDRTATSDSGGRLKRTYTVLLYTPVDIRADPDNPYNSAINNVERISISTSDDAVKNAMDGNVGMPVTVTGTLERSSSTDAQSEVSVRAEKVQFQ